MSLVGSSEIRIFVSIRNFITPRCSTALGVYFRNPQNEMPSLAALDLRARCGLRNLIGLLRQVRVGKLSRSPQLAFGLSSAISS